jgi:UDP-2-acetamido-3-amino-2,3-dideoxy-glucuronate N-acetyltransferase
VVVNYIGNDVKIGENTKIWHFTYIGDFTKIGSNTSIGSLTHIDQNVTIGSDCSIQGMVYIPPQTVIKDRVFIGPSVVFTNDPYPPSGKLTGVTVNSGTVICASAILKAGISIGENAVIGMGAIVTHDVKPNSVVYGVPARERYVLEEYLAKQNNWVNQI